MCASKVRPILAAACENSAIKIFAYDSGSLQYEKTLPTAGCRVLSVACHPLTSIVFAGCSDGTIRSFDESTGHSLFRMTGDVRRGMSTVVWSLLALADTADWLSGRSHDLFLQNAAD